MDEWNDTVKDLSHVFDPNHGWNINNDWNAKDWVRICMETINRTIRGLNKLNIIVAGKTGAGKSTLINAVFREKLADTGIGDPVTDHICMYSKPDFPLQIYDTRGMELGKDVQTEVKKEILEKIRDGARSDNIDDHIHCIWYCINTASNRFEDEELRWLRALSDENRIEQVPIIIILTQAIAKKNAEALKSHILNQNLKICQVVPVLAEDYEIDEDYTKKAYGLDTLLDVMEEVLPEQLRDTWINVQKVSLSKKVKRAQKIVAGTVAATFGVGFVPIPFSDAAALFPIQVAMIAGITKVFGLNLNESLLTSIVTSVVGAGGMTLAGRTIVNNLLKLVPGVNLATGMISGSTAGVLTTALGEAYIQVMTAICKGELKESDLDTDKGKEKLRELVQEKMKRK